MAQRYDIRNAEDRARLPKWAQQQIESLLIDKDSLTHQLATGPEDSDTFVAGQHVQPDRPLGRHVTINFGVRKYNLAKGGETSHHILDARWNAEEEELHVSSYTGTVHVIPWATNCFKVVVER